MYEQKKNRAVIIGPLIAMVVALAVVMTAHKGPDVEARPAQLEQLEDTVQSFATQQQAKYLVLCGDCEDVATTVCDALAEMKLPYRTMQAEDFTAASLAGIDTILYANALLDDLPQESLVSLSDWVDNGGRLALMMSPVADEGFAILHRKLGVMEYSFQNHGYTSMTISKEILPFWNGRVFDEALSDYAMPVQLEPDCTVHIASADAHKLPLLWTRDVGKGRAAVLNTGLLQGKDARGYVCSVLSVLEDVLVYPIINAGMVYIDDFPAPQPDGVDERLMAQYGFDIQGFFRNHWWPDMKALTWTKNIRYTGVLVETYNDTVEPPFEPDGADNALVRYYASEILQSGGEIGLHGYNHQPLCPTGFSYSGDDYLTWPSAQAMTQAISELVRYGKAFLPNAQFACYVPPSNYLSALGQQVLLGNIEGLRTLSGLYLPEDGVDALVQEFREEADGSISVPRVSSGFSPDRYNKLVIAQELALHGVFSHFLHPDDVLDDERGAALGWEKLYGDFSGMLSDIESAYPALRWSTASEGAAAVQRYDRAQITRTFTNEGLQIDIAPFYDEVWLALRCKATPASVTGAELYQVAEGFFWLRATQKNVTVSWEAVP